MQAIVGLSPCAVANARPKRAICRAGGRVVFELTKRPSVANGSARRRTIDERMKGKRMNYKVYIDFKGFGQHVTQNLYFNDQAQAETAKANILAAKLEYDRKRPNDPEDKIITIAHDLGEYTFDLDDMKAVGVWLRKKSDDDDAESRDEEFKRQTALIADVVLHVMDKKEGAA